MTENTTPGLRRIVAGQSLVVRAFLFGVAYYAATSAGSAHTDEIGRLTLFWPASGLFLAVLVSVPRREWRIFVPAAIAAYLLFDLPRGVPLVLGVLFSAANAFGAVAGAWAVHRFVGPRLDLAARRGAVLGFMLMGTVGTSTIGASIGATAATGYAGDWSALLPNWLDWWRWNALGVLAVAPLLLTWPLTRSARPTVSRVFEAVSVVVASVLLAWPTISVGATTVSMGHRFLVAPLLIWAAVRFGPRGSAWATLALMLLAVWAASQSLLPFGSADESVHGLARTLQLFVLVMGPATIFLAAAVEELRRTQERFEGLFEASPDALVVATNAGLVYAVNQSCERMFGYSRSQLIGRPVELLIPDRDLTARHADGREIAVDISLAPIASADGPMMLTTIRDITAGRSAAAAILVSESLNRSILDASIDGIVIMDADGRVVQFNPAAELMFGYRNAEAVGKVMAELIIPPSDRERHARGLAHYLSSRVPTVLGRRLKLHAMRRGGEEFPVELCIQRIGTVEPPLFTGFVHDLTDRQQLEATVLSAQKMDVVGQLAGGVAHDFNNLLTVINSAAELVLEDMTDHDPNRKELVAIADAGLRASVLTALLLSLGRTQRPSPVPLDLSAGLVLLQTLLRRVLPDRITLVERPCSGEAIVMAGPGQIDMVILNLVINSRDAIPDEGTITVASERVVLDDSSAAERLGLSPGAYVTVTVSDTGAGMDEATRLRAFEPFFSTKGGRGTGLGLSTAQEIVQRSGGAIALESGVGRGTSVRVYLPTIKGQIAEARRTPSSTTAVGKETVLVVDDEELICNLVARVLSRAGYLVLTATSGEEALRLLERERTPIDLLLSDVVMPGMSGPELAGHVRRLYPSIKILLSSGFTGDALAKHGTPDGVQLLPKPYANAALEQKVREVLTEDVAKARES